MYFVVALRLKEGQVKSVLIPMHWCFGLNMELVLKQGISTTRDIKVFYSKKKSTLPNFDLPVQSTFSENDACYVARFKTCRSK